MELYKISENKRLAIIKPEDFKIEREMQNIVQANVEQLFGDKFLSSEFTVGNYRLDTVAFDEELKSFVILEYKNMTKSSVIDQGYSYLNTLLNHKADFILLYNHFYGVNESESYFDWSQIKVIFVAKGFTQYQKDAVNNPVLPIELYEVNKYTNDYVIVNKIEKNNLGQTAHTHVAAKPKSVQSVKDVSSIALYTEEDHLSNGSEEIRRLYQAFKDAILSWDSTIEVKPVKLYIGFRIHKHNFIDIQIQKKQLKIWINCPEGELDDSLGLARNVKHIGHWGNGDYELVVKDDTNLEYILSLAKKAWRDKEKLG
jgi:predicted transport protein